MDPFLTQSVGRVELLKLNVLVKHPHLIQKSDFIVNLDVSNTCNKGLEAASNSGSCDLWKERATTYKEIWPRSALRHHMNKKDDKPPKDVSPFDIEADQHHAAEAAANFQLPESAVGEFIRHSRVIAGGKYLF